MLINPSAGKVLWDPLSCIMRVELGKGTVQVQGHSGLSAALLALHHSRFIPSQMRTCPKTRPVPVGKQELAEWGSRS